MEDFIFYPLLAIFGVIIGTLISIYLFKQKGMSNEQIKEGIKSILKIRIRF